MRINVFYIVPALFIGFAVGSSISKWWSLNEWKLSNIAETQLNLDKANDLREGETNRVIQHYESLIQISVRGFTNNGKDIASLSENDLCVLDRVIKYWEEKCEKKCFEDIAPILIERKMRITSACSRTGVPPAADA